MQDDRPLLGIMLMLAFCCVAPLGDATAKVLGGPDYGQTVFQLLLLRFVMQAVFLVPLAWVLGRPMRMSRRVTWLVFLRSIIHVTGSGLMFLALQFLPLAETVAIAFVLPFIMLLLGWLLLDEEIGWRRLAACAVGFGGTLMVIQPSFAAVGWPALLPVGVAFAFAFFMLVTRKIAKDVDPIGMQGVSGVMAVAILLPFALLGYPLGADALMLVAVPPQAITLYLTLGVLGSFGHLLMTWSLRYAPSATLAPMQYLEIPIAAIFGWMIFHDLPNGLAALGILVTMSAGMYVILRERAIARRASAVLTATAGGPGAAV
ncbi:DMT family transporter [Pseudooceanicola sp. C21-150M6]|uniref:DMT family transporter n=1 Tax=Pseudooceanicola sp. C21-150M6 TaxID=3434355 RepID=UPI003D7F925B